MSWTSLDEDDATSSSDADDDPGEINRFKKTMRIEGESNQQEQSPCNPFVQEPNSDNEINSRKENSSLQQVQNLLASKDERIRTLQNLINGQREQLYHFLKMSLKEETILELKKTVCPYHLETILLQCQETEALNHNENICMALDKFKYDNNLPTEQTMVREDVSRTLIKIERLMRHQERLVKRLESGGTDEGVVQEAEDSIAISCVQNVDQFTDVQKLLKGTKQIHGKMQILNIQLKKLALIEQERIDLVERVYSMPPDQRQYYAHLAVIEREKIQLRFDIDKLAESYRELKQKCSLLEETEQELNKCIDTKIEGLDLNKIKPGLETHLELMEMVERGELSLIAMTKDEKGKLTDDFVKLYNENAEISERLKDFDKVMVERDDLKRQIDVLVENSYRLQSEVRALRLASKTDDLLEQLRQACREREELRTKLAQVAKEGPSGVLKIFSQTSEKIAEERDELRAKLAEYLVIEEDLKSLRSKAGQSEAYRIEVERLRGLLAELEEKNEDANTRTNLSKQLEELRKVEKQRDRLFLEISRYRSALLMQEDEIKDLVTIVDKLMDQFKILSSVNPAINSTEGIPEGPELNPAVLNPEEVKRLDIIRARIRQDKIKTVTPISEAPSNSISDKKTFITSVKSFLGLHDDSLAKKVH